MHQEGELKVYNMSELQLYMTCPMKYYWTYVARLRPKGQEASPLTVGGAIHHGLERLFQGSSNAVDEALEYYIAASGAKPQDFTSAWQRWVTGFEQVRFAVEHYPWVNVDFAQVEAVEEPFVQRMGRNRAYGGKLDRRVRWRSDKYLHDTKTTGERVDFVIRKHRMRMQYKGYGFAEWKRSGVKPAGMIEDFIIKPRVNFKKDGSFSSVSVDKRGPQHHFHREPMLIRECDYEYFPRWFHAVVDRIEADMDRAKEDLPLYAVPYPMNTDACGNWNRMCEFYDLCRAPSARTHANIEDALFDTLAPEQLHGAEYILEGLKGAATDDGEVVVEGGEDAS